MHSLATLIIEKAPLFVHLKTLMEKDGVDTSEMKPTWECLIENVTYVRELQGRFAIVYLDSKPEYAPRSLTGILNDAFDMLEKDVEGVCEKMAELPYQDAYEVTLIWSEYDERENAKVSPRQVKALIKEGLENFDLFNRGAYYKHKLLINHPDFEKPFEWKFCCGWEEDNKYDQGLHTIYEEAFASRRKSYDWHLTTRAAHPTMLQKLRHALALRC